VLCVAEIIWCLSISYTSIDVASDVVMVDISDIEQHLVADECHIYMLVDLAEAPSRPEPQRCGSQLSKHVTTVTCVPGRLFVWLVRRLVMSQEIARA